LKSSALLHFGSLFKIFITSSLPGILPKTEKTLFSVVMELFIEQEAISGPFTSVCGKIILRKMNHLFKS